MKLARGARFIVDCACRQEAERAQRGEADGRRETAHDAVAHRCRWSLGRGAILQQLQSTAKAPKQDSPEATTKKARTLDVFTPVDGQCQSLTTGKHVHDSHAGPPSLL